MLLANRKAIFLGSQSAPQSQMTVNVPLCLAPMVGLTHVSLRKVIRNYLPSDAVVKPVTIWPTEMLSSRKLPRENLAETPETLKSPNEEHLVPQILGNDEASIAPSVKILEDWGAVGIDINMGCPVQKALRHNYGVSLMGDAGYAAEVVAMTKRNTQLPISVKLRAGLQNDFEFLKKFVVGLEGAGASWITLHPRLAEQKRRGHADWSQIRKIKSEISIPVIGNGDIQTAEDVLEMLNETNCDLVMAGRALAAKPWILGQIHELTSSTGGFIESRYPKTPEEEAVEYGRCIVQLIQNFREDLDPIKLKKTEEVCESLRLRKLRFYIRMTCVWLDFGQSLFSLVNKHNSTAILLEEIPKFFEQDLRMSKKTDLRE